MPVRSSVVQSNYWHKPGITVTFKHDHESPKGSVHVETGGEDVIRALAAELPPFWKLIFKGQKEKAALAAYNQALEKIKEATNKVA
jgi:hypothetical protein